MVLKYSIWFPLQASTTFAHRVNASFKIKDFKSMPGEKNFLFVNFLLRIGEEEKGLFKI